MGNGTFLQHRVPMSGTVGYASDKNMQFFCMVADRINSFLIKQNAMLAFVGQQLMPSLDSNKFVSISDEKSNLRWAHLENELL